MPGPYPQRFRLPGRGLLENLLCDSNERPRWEKPPGPVFFVVPRPTHLRCILPPAAMAGSLRRWWVYSDPQPFPFFLDWTQCPLSSLTEPPGSPAIIKPSPSSLDSMCRPRWGVNPAEGHVLKTGHSLFIRHSWEDSSTDHADLWIVS